MLKVLGFFLLNFFQDFRGPKVCNCRQIFGFDASKCATVVNFGGSMPQSVQLSPTLGVRGTKVCNCRRFFGFEASKCVTVVDFLGSMHQNVQLWLTLGASVLGPQKLYFLVCCEMRGQFWKT